MICRQNQNKWWVVEKPERHVVIDVLIGSYSMVEVTPVLTSAYISFHNYTVAHVPD